MDLVAARMGGSPVRSNLGVVKPWQVRSYFEPLKSLSFVYLRATKPGNEKAPDIMARARIWRYLMVERGAAKARQQLNFPPTNAVKV